MSITRNYSFVGASIIMGLLLIVSLTLLPNLSFAQQENQTNMTSSQQQNQSGGNQTESGTASGLENLTGGSTGNIGLLQNDTAIGSQNTSVTGGMEQEQEAAETPNATSMQQQGNQTNMTAQQPQQNETGGMMGNETNQTEQGAGNETQQGPLEQLGETLGGIFGGGSQ